MSEQQNANVNPAGQSDRQHRKATGEIRSWQSPELLGDRNEARIVHGGEVYRLMRTRNDKLILVK